MTVGSETISKVAGSPDVAVRVLAKSLFRELKRAGYTRGEMVAFASELLDLVTTEIRTDTDDDGGRIES